MLCLSIAEFLKTHPPSFLHVSWASTTRYDPSDEILCPNKFDFSFENEETTEGMKNLIVNEVRRFRRMVRTPITNRQGSGPKRSDT